MISRRLAYRLCAWAYAEQLTKGEVAGMVNTSGELGLVWVVGSAYSLSDEAKRAAQRLGSKLAQHGLRLMVGDWTGVDELVGRAFIEELTKRRVTDLHDWIVQIRRTGGPLRRHWTCQGATSIEASSDDLEYDLPAERCDACVVVAGIGGAGESARRARNRSKPVFPLPMTEGDSRDLFHEIMREWRVWEVKGVTASQFLLLYSGDGYGVDAVVRMLRAALTRTHHTFVSYRRADAEVAAGRLYADLIEAFGPNGVFMDTASLSPGSLWPERLREAAAGARVTIAVIGKSWESERLFDDNDWVRNELIAARAAGRLIVPLLVGAAVLSPSTNLPEPLHWLGDCQSLTIDNAHWAARVAEIVSVIEGELVG